MTIRLAGTPNKNKLLQHHSRIREPQDLAQSPFNGGMVTNIPPIDLQNHQAVDVVNFDIWLNRTRRRFGTSAYPATKPNSNKILGLSVYDKSDGTVRFVRFTRNSVHTAGVSSWTVITGPALLGSDSDWFNTINVDDRLLFTNSGVDVVQEIDTLTNTYAPLGNAPKVKYLTAFGDRVLGLFNTSPLNPTYVGWSGNRNYTQWDPLVDISAGSTYLTNTGTDLSDPISGALVFNNILQIFRHRSIWEATITNSYSQPFYFYQKIPGIGCDCPQSITKIPGGACFVDTFSRSIYHYSASGEIKNIGEEIIKDFLTDIETRNDVIGTYSYRTSEYQILIPSPATSSAIIWEYNFKSGTWNRSVYDNIIYIANLEFASGTLTIDELGGTIDQLLGTIDSLGASTERVSSLFFGSRIGDVDYEDETVYTDKGVDYTATIESKVFELPINAEYVVELEVEFIAKTDAGNLTIQYRKDNKLPWILYKQKVWTIGDNGKRFRVMAKKNVRCRNYQFRIVSTSGLFEIEKYSIKIDQAGESKI
jgi:hypothetical protein